MSETVEPGARVQRVRAESPDVLEALLTAAGEHVEAVLDVGTTPGGDLLLVLPEPAARLTALLAVPGWPSPGEAVTVLVPLAQALQRMHDAGVAHGSVDAGSVVLDGDGAPAWTIAGSPVLLRRAGPAAFSAAVEGDRGRFARLAEAVAAGAGADVRATGLSTDALLDALFDLAEPRPLRLAPLAGPVEDGPPARLLGPVAPEDGGGGRPRRWEPRLPPVAARAAKALRSVRRRVWVAVGAVGAALVAALVLLPGGATADAADDPLAAGSTAAVRPAAAATPTPSPTPVAPRGLTAAQALPRLLAARARCLAAGDGACLDRVVAAGSPIRTADRTSIAAGTDAVHAGGGRPRVLSDGGGTVVAEVGDTVVVAVRQPDGWRLRDVVAEPPR